MTKSELIEYMYNHHVTGDFRIEDMADDMSSKERKTGTWLQTEDGDYDFRCSECGFVQWDDTNYCPECGSCMLEGVNE